MSYRTCPFCDTRSKYVEVVRNSGPVVRCWCAACDHAWDECFDNVTLERKIFAVLRVTPSTPPKPSVVG
jgi:hypothetical protein